jgi:hypothetical protein
VTSSHEFARRIARKGSGREPSDAVPARGSGGNGNALPAALRVEFERHFDADFSAVRLHTDQEGGAAALALGARAYTLGTDVTFAPGQYAPDTAAGRSLLAHELCHVAQDEGRRPAPSEPVGIDPPGSAQEREADQAALLLAQTSSRDAPRSRLGGATRRSGPPLLHRSLFGTILGGVLGAGAGAVGGALLGGLLGPAGAIVGGIIGGIAGLAAGAILGDMASRRSRRLTATEITYLREIYRDSVDYSRVTITRGSALATASATTTGNTVNLEASQFVGDTMDLSPSGFLVLAHEMGHVWQYQHGGLAYIPQSLIAQYRASRATGSRNAAYEWRPMAQRGVPWADWNPEQQAECMSDYNEALRRSQARGGRSDGSAQELEDNQTLALAQPYVDLVRQGIGAPGSSRRQAPAQPPAAGGAP